MSRCYFRCSHKPDQGCRATKQVQQMEDDPKMYHITYIGHHTCKRTFKSPQMIPDSDPWESYSESKAPQMNIQGTTNLPLSSSVKQELNKLEDAPNDTTLFGPMMFGQEISCLDNSLNDMNDFMFNFVGFDGDFRLNESDTTATVFSYNHDDFL